MSRTIIQVENLGKLYRIPQANKRGDGSGAQLTGSRDLLNSVVRKFQKPIHEENLWAIRGVNFDVKHGEVIGIIGSNGAGKLRF
jgi:ABC-type polysaccharide/polyol phosphate transport system ATPase subunit